MEGYPEIDYLKQVIALAQQNQITQIQVGGISLAFAPTSLLEPRFIANDEEEAKKQQAAFEERMLFAAVGG